MKRRAILFDKDGTLVKNVPYNVDPERIEFADGAAHALTRLHQAGYDLVVISNQAGVGKGLFPETALAGVEVALRRMFGTIGVPLRGFLSVPHHPDAALAEYRMKCPCRKPAAGLLRQAADMYQLDLVESWMVGDTLDDVEAGRRAGCRTVLVNSGGETEWLAGPHRSPHCTVADLAGVARCVLAAGSRRAHSSRPWIRRRVPAP